MLLNAQFAQEHGDRLLMHKITVSLSEQFPAAHTARFPGLLHAGRFSVSFGDGAW